MSADELRKSITAVPFRPFTVNVADGRAVPVVGRDFILVSPVGHMVHIYQADGSYDQLDPRLITGVSFAAPAAAEQAAS